MRKITNAIHSSYIITSGSIKRFPIHESTSLSVYESFYLSKQKGFKKKNMKHMHTHVHLKEDCKKGRSL